MRSPSGGEQLLAAAARRPTTTSSSNPRRRGGGVGPGAGAVPAQGRQGGEHPRPRAGRMRHEGDRPRHGSSDALAPLSPLPRTEPPAKATDKSPAGTVAGPPRTARCWSASWTADPSVGRLHYLPGAVGHAPAPGARLEYDARRRPLLLLHGKEQESIGELKAGDRRGQLDRHRDRDTLGAKEKPLPACRRSTCRSHR